MQKINFIFHLTTILFLSLMSSCQVKIQSTNCDVNFDSVLIIDSRLSVRNIFDLDSNRIMLACNAQDGGIGQTILRVFDESESPKKTIEVYRKEKSYLSEIVESNGRFRGLIAEFLPAITTQLHELRPLIKKDSVLITECRSLISNGGGFFYNSWDSIYVAFNDSSRVQKWPIPNDYRYIKLCGTTPDQSFLYFYSGYGGKSSRLFSFDIRNGKIEEFLTLPCFYTILNDNLEDRSFIWMNDEIWDIKLLANGIEKVEIELPEIDFIIENITIWNGVYFLSSSRTRAHSKVVAYNPSSDKWTEFTDLNDGEIIMTSHPKQLWINKGGQLLRSE